MLLLSCGKDPLNKKDTETTDVNQSTQACSCTFQNAPVCGSNGVTYDNACIARCNGVNSYNNGRCCNPNSGPVCGQPPMPPCPQGQFCTQQMPNPKTYNNECEMAQDGASYRNAGSCPSTSF